MILSSADVRWSSVISDLLTWRAMLPLIEASPDSIRSIEMSLNANVEAGKRTHMRDTAAHLTCADHADFFDFDCHPELPI